MCEREGCRVSSILGTLALHLHALLLTESFRRRARSTQHRPFMYLPCPVGLGTKTTMPSIGRADALGTRHAAHAVRSRYVIKGVQLCIGELTVACRTHEPPCFEVGDAARFLPIKKCIPIRCLKRSKEVRNRVTRPTCMLCDRPTEVVKMLRIICNEVFLHGCSMAYERDNYRHKAPEMAYFSSLVTYR